MLSLAVFQLKIPDYFVITYSFSNLRDVLFEKVLVLSHGVENGCLGKIDLEKTHNIPVADEGRVF